MVNQTLWQLETRRSQTAFGKLLHRVGVLILARWSLAGLRFERKRRLRNLRAPIPRAGRQVADFNRWWPLSKWSRTTKELFYRMADSKIMHRHGYTTALFRALYLCDWICLFLCHCACRFRRT